LSVESVEAGKKKWQVTAWGLARIYAHRFARTEVLNEIAVVQAGRDCEKGLKFFLKLISMRSKAATVHLQRADRDLERVERTLVGA
jgi:hypothetical protein